MAKKLFQDLYFVLAVMLLVAVVSSMLSATLTGYVINFRQGLFNTKPAVVQEPLKAINIIRANSCDADSTCEVAEQITTRTGSKKGLVLTSDIKIVTVNDQLTVDNLVLRDNVVSTIGDNILVLSSNVGTIFMEGNVLLTGLMDEGRQDADGYVCVTRAGLLVKKRTPCV